MGFFPRLFFCLLVLPAALTALASADAPFELYEDPGSIRENAVRGRLLASDESPHVDTHPPPGWRSSTLEHGMIIDAGSGGSRMHVYAWEPREFDSAPIPLTTPLTYNRWTNRMVPGLSDFGPRPGDVHQQLEPLIAFAKEVLKGQEDRFHTFPIFLKATAGMRELPLAQSDAVMFEVRKYLGDTTKNPFFFRDPEHARILSGEEEGAYGWIAINYLKGVLKKSIDKGPEGPIQKKKLVNPPPASSSDSKETSKKAADKNEGEEEKDAKEDTFGAVEMGGASTQISFFKESQNIVADLYKLQIGGTNKHWDIYTHSFLGFGQRSARRRMHQELLLSAKANIEEEEEADDEKSGRAKTGGGGGGGGGGDGASSASSATPSPRSIDAPCFPAGYTEAFKGVSYVDGTGVEKTWTLTGHADPDGGANRGFDKCSELYLKTLHLDQNRLCASTFHGQCSIAGEYQPPLPPAGGPNGKFYAFSKFQFLWSFLGLPDDGATLRDVQAGVRKVCGLSWSELQKTHAGASKKHKDYLQYFCGLGSYIVVLLHDGYGFALDRQISSADTIDGMKLGWAFGAMLYEINALPFTFTGSRVAAMWRNIFVVTAVAAAIVITALTVAVVRQRKTQQRYSQLALELSESSTGGGQQPSADTVAKV